MEKRSSSESISFAEGRLTRVEANQQSRRVTDENLEKKRNEKLLDRSDLVGKIVENPFSDETREEISATLGEELSYDVVRTAILTQEIGEYEKSFISLSRAEQQKKIYEQIDTSAEMTLRIQKYIEDSFDILQDLPDATLYDVLRAVAFDTVDEEEIQEKYSLSQRRGFELAIVNFLDTKKQLQKYKVDSTEEQKDFAQTCLKKTLTGEVTVEKLPVGFIVYLEEQDYALLDSEDQNPKTIRSKGVTLFSGYLPVDLRGKIVLINKGGEVTGKKEDFDISKTRDHEIRHILFAEFHEHTKPMDFGNTRKDLDLCRQGEKKYEEVSANIAEIFIERAKDEIIAYFSTGKFDVDYEALGFRGYKYQLQDAKKALLSDLDLSREEVEKKLDKFYVDREKAFDTIRKIKFVAEKMYKEASQDKTSPEDANRKVTALLSNTVGLKIHRLARYIDIPSKDIQNNTFVREQDKKIVDDVQNLLPVPDVFDGEWWNKYINIIGSVEGGVSLPVFSSFIKMLREVKEQPWSDYLLLRGLKVINDYAKLYGLSKKTADEVQLLSSDIVSKKVTIDTIVNSEGKTSYIEDIQKVIEEIKSLIGNS